MKRIDLDSAPKEKIQGNTSKGDQPKWKKGVFWYKIDHMGYESLSEVVVSKLLAKSNVESYVEYSPVAVHYKGKDHPGCVSRSFRKKDDMTVTLERLHRAYNGKGLASALPDIPDVSERIRYTARFTEDITGLRNVGEYLTILIELDAFFLNEDRHTNNIAVIHNDKTLKFEFCPVFDNGLALLSDVGDYPVERDMFDCIRSIKAKPFSTDFDEQLDAAEELYGVQLHLTFTKEDVRAAVDSVRELYPDEICRRAEEIILEQMRKYKMFFK
ncbi:MAG: hypothetical protein E7638_07525 [Ruminococcaceae bacterium]|nr:hypothetical protein [Oscillospiraceae bacterium]